MVSEGLALETANLFLGHFSATATRSQEELNRDDCDLFLRIGVEAFEWLCEADTEYHRRIYAAPDSIDAEHTIATLAGLFRRWLEKQDIAEAWIAKVQHNGLPLENLEKYRECCRNAAAIVRHWDADFSEGEELSAPMATLMDEAIQEHLDGKTAEFL